MALNKDIKLSPHQTSAINKTLDNDGSILLTHAPGTGKTLTSIAIFDALKTKGKSSRALVVVPSSLRTNYVENGVSKFTKYKSTTFGSLSEHHSHIDDKKIPDSDFYVVSYEMFKKDPQKYLDKTKADTMIVDEMHNFRNMNTKNYQEMKSIRGKVKNFVGLTGTPFNNHPFDVVPLLNIATNDRHSLGTTAKDFNAKFIRNVPKKRMDGSYDFKDLVPSVHNKEALKGELSKWISHATMDDLGPDTAPKKVIQDVSVEMSPIQVSQYNYVMSSVPRDVRNKIRQGLPVSRKEAQHILPKIQQARNIMNSVAYLNRNIPLETASDLTPKTKKVLDDIQDHIAHNPKAQVLVHSHMLEGGLDVIGAGLRKRGINYGTFTGRDDQKSRDASVGQYNNGKLKVLLLSSAGTTGLNLPNTTFHAALDSHFNPSVNEQIEARGIRAGGQRDVAPENRRVIVKRYKSVLPDKWYHRMGLSRKDYSLDQWILGLAANKQDLNNQVDSLLPKTASDMSYLLDDEGREALSGIIYGIY